MWLWICARDISFINFNLFHSFKGSHKPCDNIISDNIICDHIISDHIDVVVGSSVGFLTVLVLAVTIVTSSLDSHESAIKLKIIFAALERRVAVV